MIKLYLKNLRKNKEEYSIGKWIELPAADKEIEEVLKEIGINDEQEEYFIADYECDVAGIHIKEDSSIEQLNDMAVQLFYMDEEEVKICSTIMKNENCTLDQAIKQKDMREVITLDKNESNTALNLAYSYIKKMYDGDVINMNKDTLAQYFDYERFGEDLKMKFNIDDDETIAVSNI